MAVRQWSAPFVALEQLVPRRGSVLDFGCGNGLYSIQLALASQDRHIHGVDLSSYKVGQARRAAAAAGVSDRVHFDVVAPGWTPDAGRYEVAVANDVLYLLDEASIERTVRSLAAAVSGAGPVIVKEVAGAPRWKHRLGMAQEFLAVRVLRITKGSVIHPTPLVAVERSLALGGWQATQVQLDEGYWYPHAAVVAHKPG